MKIAPIQNFYLKHNLKNRTKNTPSFGDIDYGDKITIISSPKNRLKEIRILTPEWEYLNAQFKIFRYKNGNIEAQGKKYMQDGWTMRFSAKALQDKAAQLANKAQSHYDEAMSLYEETKVHNFEEYRNHNRSEYWSKREIEREWGNITITEYDDEDEFEVLRKVKFTESKIIYEDVRYGSGLIDEYIFDRNSKQLLSLTLGKNEFLRGGYKAEEYYEYDSDGNLFTYFKNYKTNKDMDESADSYFIFDSGVISKYYQNYFDGREKHTTSASIILNFEDGYCSGVDLGYKDVREDKKTILKQYLFDTHGNIDACACNLTEDQNGSITSPTIYMYKNGILNTVATNYIAYKDNGTVSAKKLFTFKLAGQHGGHCTVNNMGLLGNNYEITSCKSEKIADYLGV